MSFHPPSCYFSTGNHSYLIDLGQSPTLDMFQGLFLSFLVNFSKETFESVIGSSIKKDGKRQEEHEARDKQKQEEITFFKQGLS